MNETSDKPVGSDRIHAVEPGTDESVHYGPSPSGLEDSGVVRAVKEYLATLEAGHKPDRQQFLERYPAIAAGLADCLDALEFVHSAAPQPEQVAIERPPCVSAIGAETPLEGLLGDFRILREIGRGGMGIVYEAQQISLGRRVALKVLPFAAALDPKHLQRFKNESQAAAHLQHTNIVPVHYVGCERGVHFYAMQYIEGQTLATVIRDLRRLASRQLEAAGPDRPEPPNALSPMTAPSQDVTPLVAGLSTERSWKSPGFFRTVAHLVVQAAEGLEHAHQLGVIHRDIKPANLLIDAGGRLWITDFGLAHCQSQPGLTMTGDLVGTLRYMSPEQALGKRVAVDARTDVYSLGVTLYELLVFEPVYPGGNREEVLRQIAFDEPRPPRRLNQAVPAELETIVLKAMAKSPEERYATAQELADDLRRFLEDRPIKAKRPSLRQRAAKWARRHKTVVRASIVVLLLAIVGLAVSAALIWQTNQDLLRTLYFEWIARADRELSANNLAGMEQLLDACPAKLRGWEWYYLKRLRLEEMPPLRHSTSVFGVAFSPDCQWIASGGQDGIVKIWEASTGRLVEEFQAHQSHVRFLAFSPDGRLLATGSWDKTAKVWELHPERAKDKHVLLHELKHGAGVDCVAFSPDGRSIASGGYDIVRFWNTATGQAIVKDGWHGMDVPVAYSPDGQSIAVGARTKVKICDIKTGREKLVLPHSAPVLAMSISRDGRWLATTSADIDTDSDGEIHIWDARTGKEVRRLRGHTSYIWRAVFSPDARRLASGGADGNVKLWEVQTGRELLNLRGHRAPIRDLSFSLDGTRLVSASQDNTVRLWDATPLGTATGQELFTLTDHHTGVRSVAFSPDGRWLASIGNDGKVLVWDHQRARAGGANLLIQPLNGSPGFKNVVFSHNSRMLASGGSDRPGVTLMVWDTTTWKELLALAIGGGYSGVAFSPDDKRVAASVAGADGFEVVIVDLATKQIIRTLRGHKWSVWGLAFSPNPDVPRLASAGGDKTVRIWDVMREKELACLPHPDGLAAIAFSHDGQLLASGCQDVVRVWDAETGTRRYQHPGTGNIMTVVFHPKDNRVLASASQDGTVKIWNTETDEIRFLRGHMSWVNGVAFSPDGEWIASASLDKTVKIWKTPRPTESQSMGGTEK
jgi:WD40 repeat protein/serine/threonine protein kinase